MAEFLKTFISGAALKAHEGRFLLLVMRERSLGKAEALGLADNIGTLNPFGEATQNTGGGFSTISLNFNSSNHVVSRLAQMAAYWQAKSQLFEVFEILGQLGDGDRVLRAVAHIADNDSVINRLLLPQDNGVRHLKFFGNAELSSE